MKKITGLFMVGFIFLMVGCTNLDEMLAGLSETLTALTGNVHKTINMDAPRVSGVSFKDYRLEVSTERNGDYTYVTLEIKGYVVNNRNSTITIEVQVPIYNSDGKISDVKKTTFYVAGNSSEFLSGKWTETTPPALQLNEKGGITSIYENGNFLGNSEKTVVKKSAPKKVVKNKPQSNIKSETTPEIQVKQVRQQRRVR